jgi:hypothetical protein
MAEPKETPRLASVEVVEHIMHRVARAYASRLPHYGLTYQHAAYEFWVEYQDERVPLHRFTSDSIEHCTDAGRAERACQYIEDAIRHGFERLR